MMLPALAMMGMGGAGAAMGGTGIIAGMSAMQGISLMASGLGALQTLATGKYESSIMEQKATMADLDAQAERINAMRSATMQDEKAAREISMHRAAIGASGGTFAGSNAIGIARSLENAASNKQSALMTGESKALGNEYKAASFRTNAKTNMENAQLGAAFEMATAVAGTKFGAKSTKKGFQSGFDTNSGTYRFGL